MALIVLDQEEHEGAAERSQSLRDISKPIFTEYMKSLMLGKEVAS